MPRGSMVGGSLLVIGVTVAVLAAAPRAEAQAILIFDENSTNMRATDAATRLGLTFTRARAADFDALLRGSRWDLVVMDMPSGEPTSPDMTMPWQTALIDHVRAGGRAIHTHWYSVSLMGLPAAFEVTTVGEHTAIPLHRWSADPLYSTPQVVPDNFTMLTDIWGTNGFYLQPTGTGRAAAGFTMMPAPNQAAIVIGNGGRTIFNGFLFDDYGAFDTDMDGIPDITELVMNEIAFLSDVFPTAPCMGRPEGSMCTAMPGGAGLCRGGVCCYGCWNGTRCERGDSGAACAQGGAMCRSCADGMPCTLDTCTAGVCSNPMAPAGTGCDDGMFCTATDTCSAAGACTGTGIPCSDGDSCTSDVCDESMDSCSFPPTATSCTIGGVCVGEGMINPAYPCLVCDPMRRADDWSTLAEGTMCGMDRCAMGRRRTFACNATGGCVMSAPMPCPTGVCLDAMSCEPGCTADSCPMGETCDLMTGVCIALPDGGPCADAAACEPDAGPMPVVDAGDPDEDGGVVGVDSGGARADGGGGRRRMSDDGGCGCRAAPGTDLAWLPVALAVGAIVLRRRRRKS
jgi:MYXO-CTERM domain-containing protein